MPLTTGESTPARGSLLLNGRAITLQPGESAEDAIARVAGAGHSFSPFAKGRELFSFEEIENTLDEGTTVECRTYTKPGLAE